MHQLTKNASIEDIEKAGLAPYYTDHGMDVYPVSAAGVPFTAAYEAVMLRRIMKALSRQPFTKLNNQRFYS